jgi:hypothetical protein
VQEAGLATDVELSFDADGSENRKVAFQMSESHIDCAVESRTDCAVGCESRNVFAQSTVAELGGSIVPSSSTFQLDRSFVLRKYEKLDLKRTGP